MGCDVHLVGFSTLSLGYEKKILETVNMDYLKNKGNIHYEYSIFGLTAAPTLGRDVRWSGLLDLRGHFRRGARGFTPGCREEGRGRLTVASCSFLLFQCLATCGHLFTPG